MKFTFGTGAGQYDPTKGYVTDSIFDVCEVSHIVFDTQSYETGFTIGNRSLNYGSQFSPIDGQTMTIVFCNPIIMEKY